MDVLQIKYYRYISVARLYGECYIMNGWGYTVGLYHESSPAIVVLGHDHKWGGHFAQIYSSQFSQQCL